MADDLLAEGSEFTVAGPRKKHETDDMLTNTHKKGIEKMKSILKSDSNKGLLSRFNWGVLAGGSELSQPVDGNDDE